MTSVTKMRGIFAPASAAVALLGVLALSLTGCDGQGGATADEVASLAQEVKEQQRLNKALMDRLDRLERKIDGHTQDIDMLSRQRVAADLAAADVAETDEEPGSASSAATAVANLGAAGDVARLLETEAGRAAVEQAMAAVQEKRDAERRERWVGAMIDRFAADANLTDVQTDDMRKVVSASFEKIGELWSGMRSDGDVSAEVRAIQREEIMVQMEEIRVQTDDEVKAILTPDQYAIYEEQSARMRNWGRGGGGRGRGGR